MSDTKIPPTENQQPLSSPSEAEALDRRRQQDLECLTLLKEAAELRLEAGYIDDIFTTLKKDPGTEDFVNQVLKELDD